MKNKIVCLFLSILVASCASYNAAPLAVSGKLLEESLYQSEGQVKVLAKKLNKKECLKYFDRDLLKKGYIPVQLYIQNNTPSSYFFSLDRIHLSLVQPEEVADKAHTSTLGRVIGYTAAAIVFFPLALPLAISAAVDGVKSSEANQSLDQDFAMKSASDQFIGKYSFMNKVVFVPKSEFLEHFSMTLIDQDTKEPIQIEVSVL